MGVILLNFTSWKDDYSSFWEEPPQAVYIQDTDSWTADQDQQLTAQQCEKKGKPNLFLTSLGRILLFPLEISCKNEFTIQKIVQTWHLNQCLVPS